MIYKLQGKITFFNDADHTGTFNFNKWVWFFGLDSVDKLVEIAEYGKDKYGWDDYDLSCIEMVPIWKVWRLF